MHGTVVLTALNAKYIHASPAPWCLAAGIKAHAPQLYGALQIIDATINQPLSDVLARILAAAPAVVGLTCYLWNIHATLSLCAALKDALPQVILVLGGPEVSYCAKDTLVDNPQIDYILAGEGEESLPAFLTALFSHGCPPHLPKLVQPAISGLCGRRLDGSVYESPPCVLGGAVPSPLTAGYAEAARGRITYMETSRGCPYSCSFCLSGRCGAPRYFPMDAVLQGLLHLARSGTRTIKFIDRTFNANPAHANQILAFILAHYGSEIPSGVCFHFEIAGDILQEETFRLLAQLPVGAVQLEIGMQSFHQKTLEAVQRKTDIAVLQSNIRRLVSMNNMHIHIDLIAGLPHEDLPTFATTFNTGYGLGAQMLQLGFLKLLHGSAMRNQPERYPCVFDENPPYEVRATPWLSARDLAVLHRTEDAVTRVYNSGRFCLTAAYVLNASHLTAFDFYAGLGAIVEDSQPISLDDYTAHLQAYCAALSGVDGELLRDMLVRDRLSTNATGRLPPCLNRQDALVGKAVKWLRMRPDTAPQKNVRRGVALLYGANTVCWTDYDPSTQHPVTGRWVLRELPLNTIILGLSSPILDYTKI